MRLELGFQARLHFAPAFFFQERGLEFAQLALRRADEVAGLARAQKLDVLLADHPAIHDPDALGLAVLLFHHFDDRLHRRHIGPVPGKDFIGKRQPLGRADQPDADLLAVGARVARVAAGGLFVLRGLPFEKGARHIVEPFRQAQGPEPAEGEELELHAKPGAVLLEQVRAERLRVPGEHIEPAVEPVAIDLRGRHAEQILQGRGLVPMLGDPQLAALAVEAGQGQDRGHDGPGHVLLTGLDQALEKRMQPEPPPERQAEVDGAEIAPALHAHPMHVDQLPPRRRRGGLRGRDPLAQNHLARPGCAALQQRLEFRPLGGGRLGALAELAQRGDDLLPRPLRRAHRLAERPVLVTLSIDFFAVTAQEHAQSRASLRRCAQGGLLHYNAAAGVPPEGTAARSGRPPL